MERDLPSVVVQAAIEVHTLLGGPGLLESIYESALCHELSLRSVQYQRQVAVPVIYKGKPVRRPLFVDLLVENEVVIEVKAIETDNVYYIAQLLTHLRANKKGSSSISAKSIFPKGLFASRMERLSDRMIYR